MEDCYEKKALTCTYFGAVRGARVLCCQPGCDEYKPVRDTIGGRIAVRNACCGEQHATRNDGKGFCVHKREFPADGRFYVDNPARTGYRQRPFG